MIIYLRYCYDYAGKRWDESGCKGFISTRVEKDGVLILSEMAGASKELFQALLVNPFDLNNMAEALYQAVNMSKVEQVERNRKMRKAKAYNVSIGQRIYERA